MWTYLPLLYFPSYLAIHPSIETQPKELRGGSYCAPKFRDGSGLTNRSLKRDAGYWIKNPDFRKTVNHCMWLFSGKAQDLRRPKEWLERRVFPSLAGCEQGSKSSQLLLAVILWPWGKLVYRRKMKYKVGQNQENNTKTEPGPWLHHSWNPSFLCISCYMRW